MVVAVVAVLMMQVTIDDVVGVIAMRDCLMSAVRTVLVIVRVLRAGLRTALLVVAHGVLI